MDNKRVMRAGMLADLMRELSLRLAIDVQRLELGALFHEMTVVEGERVSRMSRRQAEADHYHDAFESMAASQEVGAVDGAGWVSVGERAPVDTSGFFIVATRDGSVMEATFDGAWWSARGDQLKSVTHWRDMPAAPVG